MGEHAAGVPGGEGPYQRRGAVELDTAFARSLSPCELAGVPFDEGFGFRRDVEVLVEAGVRLADLGVSELDEQPIALTVLAGGPTFARCASTFAKASVDKSADKEVEADDDASIRKPVPAQRVAHRPQGYKGVEVLGGDLQPARTPLAERLADLEEIVARRRELVVVPVPVEFGCRLDYTEMFELLEPL